MKTIFTAWFLLICISACSGDSNHDRNSEGQIQTSTVTQGDFQWQHENGQLSAEGAYKDGKQNGSWVWYYDSGKVHVSGEYKNGVMVGTWKWFDEHGNVVEVSIYKDGKLIENFVCAEKECL